MLPSNTNNTEILKKYVFEFLITALFVMVISVFTTYCVPICFDLNGRKVIV